MAKSIISDMDGVIYRGGTLIDGANEFVQRLLTSGIPFLFLTNLSEQTPLDLVRKLERRGIHGLEEHHFITAGMATAMFLKQQRPGATVFAIGGGGLMNELYNAGFSISEHNPEYVVVGKTESFNFEQMKKAVQFISRGAKFIGTNPDVIDPTDDGIEPACGALLAGIESATGRRPYIVGKPNSLMMTLATKKLGVHPDDTVMIGDRMDTDIVGGMEAGMRTCLVLSGVTRREDISAYPYRPDYIMDSVADIDPLEL
ncbi:HAD-IIA family hydrolase [Spirochaeta lutea]|uniref:HAD family hydrolase n=1 Tax=Spirochaeta lutea TaxID=1480694 RepID=A0A098QVH7_9SPIO|nr:HAD-IIA family hydrolase [Spirochaeta lutea]KGE71739.1 HAD family hydrolase [Spirochaeta lutea]